MAEEFLAHIRDFLADHHTLTLATIGPHGEPQATDLYYAEASDLGLYFISVPGSRHAGNVARDPRVAATIHADSTRWRDIRGVQLEGVCIRITGTERATAWTRYTAKFPFVLADAALARALQKVDMYRITPHWLRWVDNSAGLGHNQEWILADGTWQIANDRYTQPMSFNSASEKRQYVNRMFARIAYRYDLMNRVMTGGQDVRWRRLMVKEAALPPGGRFLDIATGTGDVAFEALRQEPGLALVVGADFTLPMMQVGHMRAAARPVRWTGADTLSLPFPDDTFDAVASGFLMRNVTDVAGTLAEQRRVTRPGGRVLVLDVPRPPDTFWGELFRFYFHQIVPRLGGLISGQPDAYAYLPRSADAFMRPDELAAAMESVGLCHVRYQMLMLGTVALHVGIK